MRPVTMLGDCSYGPESVAAIVEHGDSRPYVWHFSSIEEFRLWWQTRPAGPRPNLFLHRPKGGRERDVTLKELLHD